MIEYALGAVLASGDMAVNKISVLFSVLIKAYGLVKKQTLKGAQVNNQLPGAMSIMKGANVL